MKKILVPTDFSDTAQSAYRYAQRLAASLPEAQLKIVHVFMPQIEAEYPNFVPPMAEFMKLREEMLEEFITSNKMPEAEELRVKKELLVGFAADEINRASEKADLIVMGTTGQSGVINKFFGSVSIGVAKGAHCPVILVPPEVTFHAIRHILYASNYESADEDMLEKLIDFNRYFNATIHFVHVRTDEEDDFEKTKEEIFEELFEEGEPAFAFEIEEVAGQTVTEGLSAYAEKEPIDLVVMVNCQRSFWDSLFQRSQTKRMAINTQQPLMVLHL